MDPIPVPAPPRSAYNPNRRVSDLLYSQLQHFQHIEKKRGDLGIDPAISSNIHTEGGAALYIAAITRALRGTASTASKAAAPSRLAVLPTPKPAKKPVASLPLAIAAVAENSSPPRKKSVPPKNAKKKTAKKKAAKKSQKKK
jgi:hypothetical protein